MYYTIYKTTNLINNKIYIGKHQTKNLNDSYLGSGKALLISIKKYGKENFKKEILHICESTELMDFVESLIIDEEFIKQDNYNIVVGGTGGDKFTTNPNKELIREKNIIASTGRYWSDESKQKGRLAKLGKNNPNYGKCHSNKTNEKNRKSVSGKNNGMYGKTHTIESILKIKLANSVEAKYLRSITKIKIDNIIYDNILSASKILSIKTKVIKYRLYSTSFPEYEFV